MEKISIKEEFDKKGYIVLENIFNLEEMQTAREEAKRLIKEKKMKSRIKVDEEKLRNEGVFIGLSKISPLFEKITKNIKLIRILKKLYDKNLIFIDDKLVYKNSDIRFGTPWHQDWEYLKGSHKVSVWIALDDANKENGCLQVIPGTHKNKVIHKGDSTDGFSKSVIVNMHPENIINIEVKAGDVIILHA